MSDSLHALSPLDGRYATTIAPLTAYFSEYALIRQRVVLEIRYLLFLSDNGLITSFSSDDKRKLTKIITRFSDTDAQAIKTFERTTKHDVKAVEYFLRQTMQEQGIPHTAYIHLALTSEDINNLAYSLTIQESLNEVLVPALKTFTKHLAARAEEYRSLVMLARTHGQPAVPTTLGKELVVFAMRLHQELKLLEESKLEGKLAGAVGNFNAHTVAFPGEDWLRLSTKFIQEIGLTPNLFATQILPTESYVRVFHSLQRLNLILLDFTQDMWRYISDDYLVQTVAKGQVGSSTMPQKINPIDFENAEGNLGLANALLAHFSQKLPISRLQRDLSDSTVKRSIGVAFGHCLLAYQSLERGLGKVTPNPSKLAVDLEAHWEIMAEAWQTVLRAQGQSQAYETIKDLTQGKRLTLEGLQGVFSQLDVSPAIKSQLESQTPQTYTGLAEELVTQGVAIIREKQ